MILVTGATGFLGRNLCEYLSAHNYPLRALVRPTSDTLNLESLGVELAVGDVTDANSVQAAMQGCEIVIHTAAYFRLWGPPEPFEKTNFEGTRTVLDAALKANVKKFLYISTIIVVGPQPAGTVIKETMGYNPYPTDNYAKTKARAEQLALSYTAKGLPVVALRLGALYGPYGHYAFNRLFFEEFLHNWRVTVHHGRHIIFPCYVGDAAKGIELAVRRGKEGEIYNIADESISHGKANQIISKLSNRSSWRINIPGWLMLRFVDFLEFVARFTQREPFYPRNLKPYVFTDWIVDSGKAQQELGFVPSSFSEGAKQTLDWYRSIDYKV